jgi:hypothetical protein
MIPGGMGMMMGRRGMGGGDDEDEDEDEDKDRAPMHRSHHGPEGGRGTPMQIIINIGPNNRVETEERDGGGGASGEPRWRMMDRDWRGSSLAGRVEAHLDYLHDQLQLTLEQQPAWDRFTNAVRDAVRHMRPDPASLAQDQTLEQKLAAQEAMLSTRLEAIRSVHAALSGLASTLNDSQKHKLDEVSTEFMTGRSMMQSHWR